MKHIEISLMGENELSIDGQSKPDGNIEIREFEDGEWTDDKGRNAHQERMTNGFKLFGKYFESLWD